MEVDIGLITVWVPATGTHGRREGGPRSEYLVSRAPTGSVSGAFPTLGNTSVKEARIQDPVDIGF